MALVTSQESTDKVYMVVKCPLKGVLRNPEDSQSHNSMQSLAQGVLKSNKFQEIIEKLVQETNQTVIVAYQFINLYSLNFLANNPNPEHFPKINIDFVSDVLRTVGSGRTNILSYVNKKNAVNITQKLDFLNFYNNVFSDIICCNGYEEPPSLHKWAILEETAKEMLTCIKNNISAHFITYVNRYINLIFKNPANAILKKIKDKEEREAAQRDLNRELRHLKKALIDDNVDLVDIKYRSWVRRNRILLFPKNVVVSVPYDLKPPSRCPTT